MIEHHWTYVFIWIKYLRKEYHLVTPDSVSFCCLGRAPRAELPFLSYLTKLLTRLHLLHVIEVRLHAYEIDSAIVVANA